jgi:2-polyprenyl-3-methyl-5-hydroxy-6-metoxy-1,4-benzoquinol methylase
VRRRHWQDSGDPVNTRHADTWEALAQVDPDWAVLTIPSRRYGGWAGQMDAFYATGERDVRDILNDVPIEIHRALDWGCGTGRLSFALASRVGLVVAVDIAETMLTETSCRAADRGLINVKVASTKAYTPEPIYDLVLSLLVLQHLPSAMHVKGALRIMAASIRVGGYLVFELPERPVTLPARIQPAVYLHRLLSWLGVAPLTLCGAGLSGISMRWFGRQWVREYLPHLNLELRHLAERYDHDYLYVRYVCYKLGPATH